MWKCLGKNVKKFFSLFQYLYVPTCNNTTFSIFWHPHRIMCCLPTCSWHTWIRNYILWNPPFPYSPLIIFLTQPQKHNFYGGRHQRRREFPRVFRKMFSWEVMIAPKRVYKQLKRYMTSYILHSPVCHREAHHHNASTRMSSVRHLSAKS